jgi:hypothetical protein
MWKISHFWYQKCDFYHTLHPVTYNTQPATRNPHHLSKYHYHQNSYRSDKTDDKECGLRKPFRKFDSTAIGEFIHHIGLAQPPTHKDYNQKAARSQEKVGRKGVKEIKESLPKYLDI